MDQDKIRKCSCPIFSDFMLQVLYIYIFLKYEFSYFYKSAKSCPIRKILGMLLTSESDISLILPILFNYDLIDLAS